MTIDPAEQLLRDIFTQPEGETMPDTIEVVEVGLDDGVAVDSLSINGVDIDPSTVTVPMRIVYHDFGHELHLVIRGPITPLDKPPLAPGIQEVKTHQPTATWTTDDGVTHQLHEDGSITHEKENADD